MVYEFKKDELGGRACREALAEVGVPGDWAVLFNIDGLLVAPIPVNISGLTARLAIIATRVHPCCGVIYAAVVDEDNALYIHRLACFNSYLEATRRYPKASRGALYGHAVDIMAEWWLRLKKSLE